MEHNCVFCKIVKKELEADIVYQDDLITAFLDISPLTKGHTVLIPNEHHCSMTTIPGDTLAAMMQTAPKIGAALMRATDADGFNIIISNGKCAGQLFMHTGMNILPRQPDDSVLLPVTTVSYDDNEEKNTILRKTKKRLKA